MSVVINTNYAATIASDNLAASSANLQRSLNRLSSGSKIVSPSDDAGGLAVSMTLSSAARRSGAAQANIGNAMSFLQTQDGVLKVLGKVLDRMSELKTLHTDPTKTTGDKANYETEYKQLVTEIDSLSKQKFNGKDVTSALSVKTDEAGGSAVAATAVTLTKTAALKDLTDTLTAITDSIAEVATDRAVNGSAQSVLGFAGEVLTVNKANLEAATSRIVDVDVASESTQLARWNVLVQSGTAMLAQANQSAQTALKLIS
jgi:flagellin